MRATAIAAIGMTFLGGLASYAADTPPATRHSALISDVVVLPGDSPLVRAAKISAARRAQMTVHSAKVIDNSSLITTGGHLSIGTIAPPPSVRSAYDAPLPVDPTTPANGGEQRAAAEKEKARVEALRQEQAYMASQEQEPYSEILDDHVTKRLEQIPNEIKTKPPM
jgi:hypothetical protein